MAAHSSIPVWDIFCKVVDNYGDAGVCWRVARLLAQEHSLCVRLWIDKPDTLRALQTDLDAAAAIQRIDGVAVYDWSKQVPSPEETAVAIEAFGCGLPESYVPAMAVMPQPPVWIVLDYLSAEAWVDTHHGLSSPHPSLGLQRWYFCPGFTAATGALPREHDLLVRRDAFDDAARSAFWRDLGFAMPAPDVLTVSLFAYANAPIAELLAALVSDTRPAVVALPGRAAFATVRKFFDDAEPVNSIWRQRGLEVRLLPFLPQSRYDELLWVCDLNFVRGEDSFVRAQWAGRPMIWQPYRQDDGAHLPKLQAFIERYAASLPAPEREALAIFSEAWSAGAGIDASWPRLRSSLVPLAQESRRWASQLASLGEMSAKLVEFVRNKVK